MRLELKAVMQNDGDFVNVIQLYTPKTGPLRVSSFSLTLLLEHC